MALTKKFFLAFFLILTIVLLSGCMGGDKNNSPQPDNNGFVIPAQNNGSADLNIPNKPDETVLEEWLANPFFAYSKKNFSSGIIRQEYANRILDENFAWGFRGYTWNETGVQPIEECGFEIANGNENSVDLYGKDYSGNWGVVSLLQGWIWLEQLPVQWNRPEPLPLYKKMSLKLEALHYGTEASQGQRNIIIDVWAKDNSGKILMIDFYFKGNGNNWKEANAYHYASNIMETGSNQPINAEIDLAEEMNNAIEAAKADGMDFDTQSLRIIQAEVLEELKNAEGHLIVKKFEFLYEKEK